MFDNLNYLAIAVSGLSYFILGGIWYAAIFSKQFQAALNFTEAEKKQVQQDFPKSLAVHLLSGLITAFILANLTRGLGSHSFVEGMVFGFWPWLGFVLTNNLNSKMFERVPTAVFAINSGFYLVAFAIMGGILAVWR